MAAVFVVFHLRIQQFGLPSCMDANGVREFWDYSARAVRRHIGLHARAFAWGVAWGTID